MPMPERSWWQRLADYAALVRMNRPIGSLLLLWPTLWALWIAGRGQPQPGLVVIFAAGVFLMRSAGCAMNDFADRHVDPHVERTRERPVASGRVSPREAVWVAVVLSLAAFALVLRTNGLTIGLAVVGALLAGTYPFLKRYTHLPQFYLGAAFGWGIPMAFAAQIGAVPGMAWVLWIANICWAVAYDTIYAMVDREDDRRVGVKSTAILFGRLDRFMVGLMHLLTLAILLYVGKQLAFGAFYAGGLLFAAGTAVYQQWLIRGREPAACFRAFLNNTWFGAAIFCGILLDYLDRVIP